MKVSILMASNGGIDQTMGCLQALARTVPESLAFEVVFVDNGSSDGTSSALQGVEGDFVLVRNEDDRGVTAAIGQAARIARGEILVVVRGEVIAQAGWIEALLAALDADPALDAVRPEVITSDREHDAASCFAVRTSCVPDTSAAAPAIADESLGQALIDTAAAARFEPRASVRLTTRPGEHSAGLPAALVFPELTDTDRFRTFLAELAGAGVGPAADTRTVGSLTLTATMIDGARPPAERAIAGAILFSLEPTEAVAATLRQLIAKLGPDQRAQISSLLEPHPWRHTWDVLTGGDERAVDRELFYWGLGTRRPEYSQVVADLQLLNDVLAGSALAGRYWIFGGMLLGWAREGDLLRGDLDDFDFGFSASDLDSFRPAMLELLKAGFLPRYRYPGAFEALTALTLIRHGTKFEFYRMDADGPDHYRAHSYGHLNGVPTHSTHRHHRQPLVPIEFLDRLWLKSEDHDREMTHEYGDWRTPDPNWDYMQGHNIASREPWDRGTYDLLAIAVV